MLTFGAVEDTELDEGLHFKIPFIQRVVQINNRTQKIETEGSASSKDLQIVSYVVAVNYHVNDDSSASLYQNVGTDLLFLQFRKVLRQFRHNILLKNLLQSVRQ